MKLLILSDSHYSVEPMIQIAEFEKPDAIIHLGDMWDDAQDLGMFVKDVPIYHVVGNCDSYRGGKDRQEEIRPVFEGVRFLATHGHKYNVKMQLYRLTMAAMEEEARVALFGHTHHAYAEEANGVLLLNPGSCRGQSGTYAVMDVKDGRFTYRFGYCKDVVRGKLYDFNG